MESLASCLAQTHENIEILIGDDSSDAQTQILIEALCLHEPRVRYVRNDPPLGQADNVASLFARATGEKILLIHDDDALTAHAVEKLLAAWTAHPDLQIAFGDQYEMDAAGHVDHAASRQLNIDFHRTAAAAGLQKLPGKTGLIQMMPNNGWMANADLVRQVGYRKQYGMCCDFVFGSQMCLAAEKVFYTKEYVSYYRKTDVSISNTTSRSINAASVSAYSFLTSLTLAAELEPARHLAFKRLVPIVVSVYARNNEPMQALGIALGHLHAYRFGLSKRLYFHLLLIMKSLAGSSRLKAKAKARTQDA